MRSLLDPLQKLAASEGLLGENKAARQLRAIRSSSNRDPFRL